MFQTWDLLVPSKEPKSEVRSIDIYLYLLDNKFDLIPFPKIFLTLMVKKLNFHETLKLLQSDDIYSSCDESDFDETQLIELFSSEDSGEDDSIIEDEVVCLEQEILSNVQLSSFSHFSNEELPRNQVDESLYETVGEGNRSKDKKGGDDW